MADKQWLMTKIIGCLMGIFMFVSTCIGGANIFASLRRDIDKNVVDINKNYTGILAVSEKIDGQSKEMTDLKLQDRENVTKIASLTTILTRMELKIDKLGEAR